MLEGIKSLLLSLVYPTQCLTWLQSFSIYTINYLVCMILCVRISSLNKLASHFQLLQKIGCNNEILAL